MNDHVLQVVDVKLISSSEGRSTGEAFVEFVSEPESRAAMAKNKESIGSRYVELFPSSRCGVVQCGATGALRGAIRLRFLCCGRGS